MVENLPKKRQPWVRYLGEGYRTGRPCGYLKRPENDRIFFAEDFLVRIGAVSYLNTKPLIFGLQELMRPDGELILDLPSRLADQLKEGSLDIALIPSIEFFQDPTYTIYSNACIGCRGPVWSVKLLFRVPPQQARTFAFDEGSRTSVALASILIHDRFQRDVQARLLRMDENPYEAPEDAVLVIGDRAMKTDPERFIEEWDLGEEWFQETKLPFVFAMWVGKPMVDSDLIDRLLEQSRDNGLKNIETIASRVAPRYGLSYEECLRYLARHLQYHLEAPQLRGLSLFYSKAAELGLAPRGLDPTSFRLTTL